MDAAGNVYYALNKVVKAIAPSGTETTVVGLEYFRAVQGLAAAADGSHYLVGGPDNASVYRLKSGVKTLYAGKEGQGGAQGGAPNATALKDPRGLAVADDGTLYVLDDGVLLRFKADKPAETVLAQDALKDGETVLIPRDLERDAQGRLYLVGTDGSIFGAGGKLFRLEADGTWKSVYAATDDLDSYIFAPDGTLYVAEIHHEGVSKHSTRVIKVAPGGQPEVIIPESAGYINQSEFAFDAQGRLLFRGSHAEGTTYLFDRIWRHVPASTPELLPDTTLWPEARDAKGREYVGRQFVNSVEINNIRRYDPATGTTEVLAGTNGRFFNGTGVDDGVDWPLYPAFDAKGNLYFLDQKHKQVKRVPVETL
jgi:hypothetical protein